MSDHASPRPRTRVAFKAFAATAVAILVGSFVVDTTQADATQASAARPPSPALEAPPTPQTSPTPPAVVGSGLNVITVIVDDLNDVPCDATRRYLPRTSRYLKGQGTCFENATVDSPVCCPARAAYMTGQLPHNNGVRTIQDGAKITIGDTVQHDLREAGLETYGTGKFLNGVKPSMLAGDGYDRGFTDDDFWKPGRYRSYRLVNDQGRYYRPAEEVHTTVRTGRNLNGFISRMLEQDRQFYAYGAFMAPHEQRENARGRSSRTPEPTRANRTAKVPPFRFAPEADTTDKLPVFQGRTQTRAHYAEQDAARIRSLYDVDDQLADMFAILESHDALDTTMVVFTSDNGYQLGQNNWEYKGAPYPASLDVPLLAYLPTALPAAPIPGTVVRRSVSLIDVTATIYDVLGLTPAHVLDGHSLLGAHRRRAEYHELTTTSGGDRAEQVSDIPSWSRYETRGGTYIQFYDRRGKLRREEFYGPRDRRDERNLLYREFAAQAPSPATLRRYRAALQRLKGCAGTSETGAARPCT